MIRNYLKVALRYLVRHKGYSFINILGLAVGITCCVLIMLFVKSEFSYDAFHTKADRLYRAWQHEKYQDQDFINSVTPLPMAGAIQKSYGEVESTCRIYTFTPMVKVDQNSFTEGITMVDSTFFKLFDFQMIKGNRANPFPTANSAIISPELAKKYFGEKDPIGKNIEVQINSTDKVLFSVAGIAKRPPEESSIRFDFLIPFSNGHYLFRPGLFTSWFNIFGETYVLLKEGVDAKSLEKKFPTMMKQQLGEDYKEGGFRVFLQPIKDIHLNPNVPVGIQPTSNPKYSYILATIGILILLVACVNFITLSIGRSATRAMEVGVRKALGAERKQLIRQFWGEAFLLTMISVIIGLTLAVILVKPFNQLIVRNLVLRFDLLFMLFCILMIALIAFVAGMYPALILSKFNPVEVLKGKLKMGNNSGWLRQSLIVGQFVASIAMIICTIAIGEQMKYLRTKDLGYQKDQVIVVPTNMTRKLGLPLAELYRNELIKHPQIAGVSVSLYSFAQSSWINFGFTDDKKVYHSFDYNMIDAAFIKTMGIQVIQGRNFSEKNPADQNSSAIVNEAFLKEFKITDPIGKKLPGKYEQQIVGVVKDFNVASLHQKIGPLLLTMSPDSVGRRSENVNYNFPAQPRVSVKFSGGSTADNIALLEKSWKAVAPNQDFEYAFLDETLAAQYQEEQRTSTIVKLAAGLSIFIACMGLFGLATLSVVRRTKEIGIRKVMGASVRNIVGLLSKEFVTLIAIAAVIAFPLAWWFLNDWLKDFAYRVHISWWVYAAAAILALMIALITVSLQAIKAALANPVKSLRTE
ncbi:MAG TPA: ABC transporter permease [Chitinophagaceae bacterium]|nr:ABC transporter permease [Chitinophagaceae bacterium]